MSVSGKPRKLLSQQRGCKPSSRRVALSELAFGVGPLPLLVIYRGVLNPSAAVLSGGRRASFHYAVSVSGVRTSQVFIGIVWGTVRLGILGRHPQASALMLHISLKRVQGNDVIFKHGKRRQRERMKGEKGKYYPMKPLLTVSLLLQRVRGKCEKETCQG